MSNTAKITLTDRLKIDSSLSISSRSYLSIQHILSSILFVRQCANIERNYDGKFREDIYMEHCSYAISSIFSSVAFLEASINELFTDAEDGQVEHLKGLGPSVVRIMSSLWKYGVPRTARYSILEKFQIALILAGKHQFEEGLAPYQDANLAIKLRNAFIHYEPETITIYSDNDRSATPHKFYKILNGKFALNPLAGEGNAFYPDKCLGHGCAKWALSSSLEYADEFYLRIGVKPPYDHVRSKLSTE